MRVSARVLTEEWSRKTRTSHRSTGRTTKKGEAMSTVESIPKTFHVGERRVAYYPETMEMRVLVADERADVRTVPEPVPPETPHRCAFGMVTFFPTNECNLACRYCYLGQLGIGHKQDGTRAPSDLMHDRTVCRALDLLSSGKRMSICLFGGEPLLAWGKCQWIVERAEHAAELRRIKPKFHVTTNGTLLTPKRCAFLVRHGFSVIVSIDGPRNLHNAARVDATGQGTHDRVLVGLKHLRDAGLGPRTTLRATYIPGEKPEDFVARLEYLEQLCDAGFARCTSVEPASGCVSGCGPGGGMSYTPGEIGHLVKAGVAWALARVRAGHKVSWMHLVKTLRRLMHREKSWTECGAAKGTAGVAPDGTLHACHHFGYEIGNVVQGVDVERCEPWFENRMHVRERCARCWVRFLCGGGCRMQGWYITGQPGSSQTSCAMSKARAWGAIVAATELADEPEALALLSGPRAPRPPKDGVDKPGGCDAHTCEASCQLDEETAE